MVDRIRLGLTSGFVSVAFWIVVYTPQIIETISIRSGEGLSVAFLLIWLVGDITGLVGAAMQRLTPSIALSAIYYTFCDVVLLGLIYYYRRQRAEHPERFGASKIHLPPSESTPLLDRERDDEEEERSLGERLRKFAYKHRYVLVFYVLATAFIASVGVGSWISLGKRPAGLPPQKEESWSTAGQIIGWTSAFLYLGSRIPQIFKNTETKCQGLSLMMFALSVMGNVTYSGAILLPNTSAQHIWVNLSWLVGSAGTILLDFIVLGQFVYYRKERHEKVFIAGGESDISGI